MLTRVFVFRFKKINTGLVQFVGRFEIRTLRNPECSVSRKGI